MNPIKSLVVVVCAALVSVTAFGGDTIYRVVVPPGSTLSKTAVRTQDVRYMMIHLSGSKPEVLFALESLVEIGARPLIPHRNSTPEKLVFVASQPGEVGLLISINKVSKKITVQSLGQVRPDVFEISP